MATQKTILGDDPFAPAQPAAKPAATDAPPAAVEAQPKSATTPKSEPPPPKSTAASTSPRPQPGPPPSPRRVKPQKQSESADVDYGPTIDRADTSAGGALGWKINPELAYRPERADTTPSASRGPIALWKTLRSLAIKQSDEGVDAFGRSPLVVERYGGLLDFLYKTYFRVEARGLGHLPDTGRALIVSNHSGMIPYDSLMIMHAVATEHSRARLVRPLVEDFLFHFPYLGTALNRLGGVRACPENAERLLDDEQLIAVFPEGQKGISKLFSERYQLQRFGRGGFVKLALRKNAPIIPTAVVGAEEIHPTLGRLRLPGKPFGLPYLPLTPTFPWLGVLGLLPLPSKWFIAFGEPMFVNTEFGPEGAEDRVLVNRLSEQVRNRIQAMLEELRAARG